jgi:glycosyltransferase involved in cell wall biosynthesis
MLRIEPQTEFALCFRYSRWRKGHLFGPDASNARVQLIQDPLNGWLLRGARVFHSMGLFMARTPRIPKILTIHDLNPVRNPQWSRPKWTRKRGARYTDAIQRSDHLITPSGFMAAEVVEQYRIAPERVHAIPHGVDTQLYRPPNLETLARVRGRWGDYVIAVGLLTPRKNFPRLIEALGQVKDARLLLVGRATDASEEVEKAIEHFGVQERVTRLQKIPQHALIELLGAARACVVPSLYEGFGLSALEALACGTPTVCSEAASLPEVVGNAALLVDATDPEALADGLRRVLESEELAADLGRRGRERALSMTWEVAARRHLDLYREVAGI